MRGKARTERGKPKAAITRIGLIQAILQRQQHRRAAEIAVSPESAAGFVQLIGWKSGFQCIDHVLAAGVCDDLIRVDASTGKKLVDGLGCNLWHLAGKLIAKFATGVHEADFFPLRRDVEGAKIRGLPLLPAGSLPPEGCTGAVAKETGADQHTRIVIEIEGSGTDLDRNDGHQRIGIGGEETLSGMERG